MSHAVTTPLYIKAKPSFIRPTTFVGNQKSLLTQLCAAGDLRCSHGAAESVIDPTPSLRSLVWRSVQWTPGGCRTVILPAPSCLFPPFALRSGVCGSDQTSLGFPRTPAFIPESKEFGRMKHCVALLLFPFLPSLHSSPRRAQAGFDTKDSLVIVHIFHV